MTEKPGAIDEQVQNSADVSSVIEEVDRLNEAGWALRTKDDWETILAGAARARELSKSIGYQRGIAASLRNSAFANYMLSRLAEATAESMESLRLFEEMGDLSGESHARTVIAYVQWSLGNYDRAMGLALRALDLAERGGDPNIIGWASTLIGGIHDSLRDYEKALHYYRKGYEISMERDEPIGEARNLIGIASAYRALGDSTRTLECLNRSLEVFRRIQNRIGEARALHDIGLVYQDQGRDDEAVHLLLESLRIREQELNRAASATSLLSLGRLYLKRGDHAAALASTHRALDICSELGANPKAYQAHQLLSQIYERKGDLASALRHERDFHRIREEVFSEESSTRLRNLQTSFETEHTQREAEMHRQRSAELKEKNDELARLLAELQATQMQLVHHEKMASLGGLVAAIVHEINSPLGTIQSSSDLSLRLAERMNRTAQSGASAETGATGVIDALVSSQQVITRGVQRIAEMVGNLKSFAHLDGAEYAELDIVSALESVLALVRPQLKPSIRIVKDFEAVPAFPCQVAELNQVFMNLLENAVQAIDGDGTVTISTVADEQEIRVRFTDTGRGIPPESLARIFDASIRTKGDRARASISLFTSLFIVRKHGGAIDVESELGKGSTFTVRLPVKTLRS